MRVMMAYELFSMWQNLGRSFLPISLPHTAEFVLPGPCPAAKMNRKAETQQRGRAKGLTGHNPREEEARVTVDRGPRPLGRRSW